MADPRSELVDALATHIGVAPLTPTEIESVLALAAVAAHGTGDRTAAPLVSFLAGLDSARSDQRTASLEALRHHVGRLTEDRGSP